MAHATDLKKDAHPTSRNVTTQLKDIEKKLPLRVLSEDDWQHWITKGYVIVRNAVPQENVQQLTGLRGSSTRRTRRIPPPGMRRSAATTS